MHPKVSGGVLAWLSVERGADMHIAQLMPVSVIVSCFSKIQIGFIFLVLAHPGSPGQGPLNVHMRARVCVCVCFRPMQLTRFELTLCACSVVLSLSGR